MRRRIHKRFSFNHISKSKKILIILIASLYAGILLGSLIPTYSNQIQTILIGYTQSILSNAPPIHVILNSLVISFLFYCALFFLGVSPYGYLLVPILPFIKGISYGFSAAFLYRVFGVRGLVVCFLGLIPQSFLFSALLIAGAYYSATNSLQIQSAQRRSIKRFATIHLLFFACSFALVIFDFFCTNKVFQLFC